MNIFKRSFPYNPSTKHHLITALSFGVFIFIFLVGFKPFQLDTLPTNRVILVCGFFGFIAFIGILVPSLIVPKLFPSFFIEEKWTTGKQILYISCTVILIGLLNYLASPLVTGTDYSLRRLLWYQGITIMVALLPIALYTLFKQNRLLRKFETQAADLEKKLQKKLDPDKQQEPPVDPPSEKKNDLSDIELTGDYQGEKIVLPPQDLYFIAAANNYVKVFFIKNGKVSYSVIRMTMKKAEETLAAWPAFFRCHRAYIVNLDKVKHVEGNAQGYKIRMDGVEDTIPVSRNLNNEFSDKLLAFRNNIP